MFGTIEKFLTGKEAKANFPINSHINPEPTFIIIGVRVEKAINSDEHKVSVRGKNTAWFGSNSWELV